MSVDCFAVFTLKTNQSFRSNLNLENYREDDYPSTKRRTTSVNSEISNPKEWFVIRSLISDKITQIREMDIKEILYPTSIYPNHYLVSHLSLIVTSISSFPRDCITTLYLLE